MSRHTQNPGEGADVALLRRQLEESQRDRQELEEALGRARQELHEAVSARDEFITIAAHELRNPLGAIMLYVQNLVLSTQRDRASFSEEIRHDLMRLEVRINDFIRRAGILLDVTRLTSGNFSLQFEDVDLTRLAERVTGDFSEQARRAECNLQTELQPDVGGRLDSLAVEQVMVNLVSNAIKYGAGHPVRVVLRADARFVRFRVEDRGIGISDEAKGRIFDKFERAVKSGTAGGFGVGLWITNQLVQALGGTIEVESEPGAGSTFSVTLPREPLPRTGGGTNS